MSFIEEYSLKSLAPDKIGDLIKYLPKDQFDYKYFESPEDWSNEILYFLLPDRFSDENTSRPLLDRDTLVAVRGSNWSWEKWAQSGKYHFQGGTIKGMKAQLGYLKKLGITAIWVGPVFKQRDELDTYHGYGIQNFLDVDPRFGTRRDLMEFVKEAHENYNIRVILDIVFNHMGANFLYPEETPDKICYWDNDPRKGIKEEVEGEFQAKYKPKHEGQYDEGQYSYLDIVWKTDTDPKNDKVLPIEFQDKKCFTRAGTACDLGAGAIDDPKAEHKRTDFCDMRDFDTSKGDVLDNLIKVYKYWIALTDCDGFRIDTTKHVTWEEAKTFCGAIKEYAQCIGKDNFFLVAETTGGGGFSGETVESYYLDAVGQNLNATLDIDYMKRTLNQLIKGEVDPQEYFKNFRPGDNNCMGSHRSLRNKYVSILEQHDDHKRFSSEASNDHQVVAGIAFQLFALGIPCIYFGTEQAFSGPPEESEQKWLTHMKDENLEWGQSDIYTREAMFGPKYPKRRGKEGLMKLADGLDESGSPDGTEVFPGFGPFGTRGYHCFDENHPVYKRIAALTAVRQEPKYPALRQGRQYMRAISIMDDNPNFKDGIPRQGELVAWSRIQSDEEIVCVVNSHKTDKRGAKILVDVNLSGSTMSVIANTEEIGYADYAGRYPVGSAITVQKNGDQAFIEITDVLASEVIVLANHQ
jgi:glycosidase